MREYEEDTGEQEETFAVGDTVVMIRPGQDHYDEGLYKGISTVVVSVDNSDSFLWILGKKSPVLLGCFPSRVRKIDPSPQLELFD